ncbi:MAG: hypothetical protein Q9191_001265 [Dirinaria sp. TL-2023a]
MASEGVFAINKPKSVSSAQALRDLQKVFNRSTFFAPWLSTERTRLAQEASRSRGRIWKRKKKNIEVKLGHGGTLDPMATGVLIVGVGKGTKSLPEFLGCTKSYEATVLFGTATDTYDTLGKLLGKAPYAHLTREKVENVLERFRGKTVQRPPLYSALHVQGKRLYEYAREGKDVPVEIEERPVEVKELEILEWLEGGSHEYTWPTEEAEREHKFVAEKIFHLQQTAQLPEVTSDVNATKRKRSANAEDDHLLIQTAPALKKQENYHRETVSGASQPQDQREPAQKTINNASGQQSDGVSHYETLSKDAPPAVRLRMTVSSGFYVRSLAHDLGKAVGSLGCMSKLVRTRQERFELGRNVLEFETIEKGEEVWAPKLKATLEEWHGREGDRDAVSDDVSL